MVVERDLYKLIHLPPELDHSGALEVKIVKNGRFAFAQVQPHQRKALLRCQERQLIRFNDAVGGLGSQLPYDFNFIHKGVGYVGGVFFILPRKDKILLWITINKFLEAERVFAARLKRPNKSMTYEECLPLATFIQKL